MTHSVDITRTFNASPELLYKAWSDPKFMRRWFCPAPEGCRLADTDFVQGGYYMLLMVVNENVYPHHGKYKKLVPNELIEFSWNTNVVQDTLVSVQLRKTAEGTELRLLHTGFESQEQCDNHNQGWNGCLDNLGLAVSE